MGKVSAPNNQTADWFAIYTKPRTEKMLAERLSKIGIEIYCPLQQVRQRWSDRCKKVTVPIIASYLFVRVTEAIRSVVLRDPAALNFVFWLGRPARIRAIEIQRLRHFLERQEDLELMPITLKPGDRVRWSEGPLKGQTGTVMDAKGQLIYLVVEEIGYALSARVPATYAEEEIVQSSEERFPSFSRPLQATQP